MIIFHYTDKRGYEAIMSGLSEDRRPWFPSLGLRTKRADDIVYGPGWYATDLPPTTSTRVLLNELWAGNEKRVEKTAYWLRLSTSAEKVSTPDPDRPHLMYIPFGDESLVDLVDAGSRTRTLSGATKVQTLYSPESPVQVVWPAVLDAETVRRLRGVSRPPRQSG